MFYVISSTPETREGRTRKAHLSAAGKQTLCGLVVALDKYTRYYIPSFTEPVVEVEWDEVPVCRRCYLLATRHPGILVEKVS